MAWSFYFTVGAQMDKTLSLPQKYICTGLTATPSFDGLLCCVSIFNIFILILIIWIQFSWTHFDSNTCTVPDHVILQYSKLKLRHLFKEDRGYQTKIYICNREFHNNLGPCSVYIHAPQLITYPDMKQHD